MERQEGYYWVKYKTGYQITYWGEWTRQRWKWFIIGSDDQYNDSDFEHINENRIKQPGELPD